MAAEYGVPRPTISSILNYKTWAEPSPDTNKPLKEAENAAIIEETA